MACTHASPTMGAQTLQPILPLSHGLTGTLCIWSPCLYSTLYMLAYHTLTIERFLWITHTAPCYGP